MRELVPTPAPSSSHASEVVHVDEEKSAITVSLLPEVTNVAVPLKEGVTRNATSGMPLVEPQLSGVWLPTRPVKLNE